ncbi:hypothetical protein [Williamsoniiplasma luminosum]|uniref:Uncharacterized protein n=1 Tax=Williamsoniiplasma luminosum TaxID=214888 RepID=A0A2S0NKW6_9MOLU|nr:hypothetical protein [Williamsoniiplasma luminosum]AVP49661.1 MAG: hypothetical protein C5T88_03745 [Williamsoniiplasma luminosum]
MKKKISRKYKWGIGLLIFYILTSWILLVPGMGIEAKLFISSADKQIQRILPKNKYILDPSSKMYEAIMTGPVKNSYIAAAVSTINFSNQDDYEKFHDQYVDFAKTWFENRWNKDLASKKAIDFNDIGIDMIAFDEAVASKFQSFGFVHTGIEWIFHPGGLGEIFSKDLQKVAETQDFVWDQKYYDDQIQVEMFPELLGLRVKDSIGSSIVNNKVWFLNQQIDSLKFVLKMDILDKPFMNKDLKTTDIVDYVQVNDLHHPDFAVSKRFMKAATINWFLSFVIGVGGTIYLVVKIKKEKQ